MGLFDRFRTPAAEPWEPPQPGSCRCEEHVAALHTQRIPRVSDDGDVLVGALLESKSLHAEPAGPEPVFTALPVTGQRVGPLHWKVTLDGEARDLYDPHGAAALDDCLSVQAGVDRVAWPEDGVLLVGAPEMCPEGVLAAVVRALENPRLRTRD